jgi:NAD(P)-dependent dehydrogenase (short-subunit alcohol dehydrogenase family)
MMGTSESRSGAMAKAEGAPVSTILITGCSSGFGLLTAVEFARAGDDVYAGVRDAGTAEQLRAAAQQHANLNVVVIDVVDPASVEEAVADVVAASGRIDVLVNNAAVATFAAVEDTDDDEAGRIMETNFMGPLRVTRAVLPQMRAQGEGRVILVSSVNGFVGLPFTGVYSASKFALEAMGEALAMEVAQLGITVSIIEPGPYHTAIDAKLALTKPSVAFPGAADAVAAGRHAMASDHPEEVAAAIVAAARAQPAPLRVPVGAVAQQLYEMRRAMDDEAFFPHLMTMLSG